QVAYVDPTGAGTECSWAMPCGTLTDAVATGRPYVKIAAGVVKDTKLTSIDGKIVTILAERGAQLDRDGNGPILEIRSANAAVTIYDLEISGATNPGGDGIQLQPNGGSPTLLLARVTIRGNQGRGI